MKAILVYEVGGPENLQLVDVPVPRLDPGQALVKLAAIGVNFIDIYFRTGLYKSDLPVALGMEGSGIVEAVAEDVTEVSVGDRVAYAMPRGSYAEYHAVPAWQLVMLPDDLDYQAAAASMLQGMTAHYLTHATYPLKEGDVALVHAAAGGAGLMTVQMAKLRGAKVIGTVGSEEKVKIAQRAGADEVINYREQDFEIAFQKEPMDVILDMVGGAYTEKNIKSLALEGRLVQIALLQGSRVELDIAPIMVKRLTFTGSTLRPRTVEQKAAIAQSLLSNVWPLIEAGKVGTIVHAEFALADAPKAHEMMQSSTHIGKIMLKVRG
jgi:NADPH2:quinone reductase